MHVYNGIERNSNLFLFYSPGYGRAGVHETGLQFIVEPPPNFLYLNSTGGELHCRASGSPSPTVSHELTNVINFDRIIIVLWRSQK